MPSVSSEGDVPFSIPGVKILLKFPAVGGGGGEADGLGRMRRGGVTSGLCTVDMIVQR